MPTAVEYFPKAIIQVRPMQQGLPAMSVPITETSKFSLG